MSFFNGTIAIMGGVIGAVLLILAIINGQLNVPSALLSGLLILFGLLSVWTRIQRNRRHKRYAEEIQEDEL